MRDYVGSRQKLSSVKFTVIVCRLRKVLKCDFFLLLQPIMSHTCGVVVASAVAVVVAQKPSCLVMNLPVHQEDQLVLLHP